MSALPPCDVLIIGAGPAGSWAAISAASGGARVALVDSKVRIGGQPHCGEFVPEPFFREAGISSATAVQPVSYMETVITDFLTDAVPVRARTIPSRGFLIDRVRLDRDLARQAAGAGATVMAGTRFVGLDSGACVLSYGSIIITISPRYIIAADGAASAVAAALGMEQPEFLKGIQAEVPLTAPMDRTVVFLDRAFVGGYGWLFPKGSVANVGLGVVQGRSVHPPELLSGLLDRLNRAGMIRPGRLATWGGLIPVSGMRGELVAGNTLLCGDAAGLTHPVTGAGMMQAVISGKMAGQAVADALKLGTDGPLTGYEKDIKAIYSGVINHALSKRRVMTARWNEPDFAGTCERTWIGFPGYKKRERS